MDIRARQLFLWAQRLAHDAPQRTRFIKIAVLLRHLLPGLLLSLDGRITRKRRFELVAALDITQLVAWLLAYASGRPLHAAAARSDKDLRARAAMLIKQPGGLHKASQELSSKEAPAPHNAETLEALRAKHPDEAREAIEAAAAAVRDAGAAAATTSGLTSSSRRDRLQCLEDAVKRANYHTAPGPDGLRYAHLQAMLKTGWRLQLLEAIEDEREILMAAASPALPDLFWQLFTAAQLNALGAKKRPIACGNVGCRLVGSAYLLQRRAALAATFEAAGQYGVGSASGTEKVALTAQTWHDSGRWVIQLDGANAFNAMHRAAILTGVAQVDPASLPYVTRVYADLTPDLLYAMPQGNVVIPSRTGARQGDTFGGTLFCSGLHPPMTRWAASAAAAGEPAPVAFIDDIFDSVASPLDLDGLQTRFQQRETELADVGYVLQRRKCKFLPPRGHHATAEERRVIEEVLGCELAEHGLMATGVPVGSPTFIQSTLTAMLDPDSDPTGYLQLLRHVAAMEDTQAATLLATQCLTSRWVHLARTSAQRCCAPPLAAASTCSTCGRWSG